MRADPVSLTRRLGVVEVVSVIVIIGLIRLIGLIGHIRLIGLIRLIRLIRLIGLISPIGLIGLIGYLPPFFFPCWLNWFMVMSMPARTKLLMISTAVSMAG